MMNQHQTALISLLLGSFPTFQSGDGEAALAAYEVVISQADERDVHPGVMAIINGEFVGHDGRFAPTAPQLAGAIRAARDKRLESESRTRRFLAPPQEPEISPEERERVNVKFDALVANIAHDRAADDAERDKRSKERGERELRWLRGRGDLVEVPGLSVPVSSTLLRQFSVGDPDGDRDVA